MVWLQAFSDIPVLSLIFLHLGHHLPYTGFTYSVWYFFREEKVFVYTTNRYEFEACMDIPELSTYRKKDLVVVTVGKKPQGNATARN